ncbi:Adenylate kinase isoenzyme 1 [Strongyloides ratti]|uniref:Adenylate kinase isoenzyme 1 n=1 Tax=Strongyloides ratti TaxID=34506 RepID=A0A090L513_STRRB|nr:Adenylate kinase isoenzyme 1 [Strongyloides ratti]CEF64802.1 Adenylate kinase isoenzyme 1 [Strongyloides ratti]
MSLSYGLRDHNIIAIVGGPGAGKKTQCEKFCKKLNYTYVNTGDLLRIELTKDSPRANEIRKLMASNLLVPRDYIENIIMTTMIDSVQGGTKGFILDGYPRDTAQAESFQKKFKPFKRIIYLDVSTPTLTRRLLDKGRATGRNDLTDDVVQRRLRNFKEITMPFVESYKKKGTCVSVNGENTEDAVSNDIEKLLN